MLYLDALKFEPVANIINKYIKNRKLVLLGDSLDLKKLLCEKYQIQSEYIATSVKGNLEKGKEYHMLSDFAGKSDEFYICIPYLQYNEDLKVRLESYGYKEFKDFVFAHHQRIVLPAYTKNYEDEYGNKVISSGLFKVVLSAISGNSIVNIDESVIVNGNSNIVIGGTESEILIEEQCVFGPNAHFEIFPYAKIIIHAKSTFGHDFTARATAGSLIEIGKDCMFSDVIEVYAGDGHSIFDVKSRTRLNECYPLNVKNSIILAEHVWVGLRSIILASTIGKHSIIGAGAVIKGKFPEYCIAVGNPAVVKKKDVTWSRSNYAQNIIECGEEFINI